MMANYIINFILTLFYCQQTLILYWCFNSEKITGTIYSGYLSNFIFICSFFGNMALGPLKGVIENKCNRSDLSKIMSGIIPQIIFGLLITSIYYNFKWLTLLSIILWFLVGMIFVSASDSVIDDSGNFLFGNTTLYAISQYIGSRILARITFSYMSDYYSQYKSLIYYISLSSIFFGIIIYILLLPFHENRKINKYPLSFKNISYLIFPPLFMILFESIFLDIPLSSLKFIISRFQLNGVYFISSSFISNVEIIFSSLFVVYISFSNIFKNLDFKKSWERYSKYHLYASLFRILLTIILVYLMNIQQVGYTDKYYMATITKKSFYNEKIYNYAMITNVSDNIIKFFVLLISISNTIIDCFTNVVMVVLLKNYSKNKNIRYSELDGWIRLFTYIPAILPWIKRNPMLSFYSSKGYLVNSMIYSIFFYAAIQYWNYRRLY